MGSRQIVLVATAGFSVLNTGIFWREAKTKRLFSQCSALANLKWQRTSASARKKMVANQRKATPKKRSAAHL
jgi:hypothetical protein